MKTILITGSKDYPAFSSVTEYAKQIPEGYRFAILTGREDLPKFEDTGNVRIYRLPIFGTGRMQPFCGVLLDVF